MKREWVIVTDENRYLLVNSTGISWFNFILIGLYEYP